MKNKVTTFIVVIATLLLAGVAVFTAVRLFQLREKPVAPNVPASTPAAAGTMCGGIQGIICPTGEVCVYSDGTTRAPSPDASGTCQTATTKYSCQLRFSLATPSPTPTRSPSPTPTRSPSPTPSPTPVPGHPSCSSKKVYFASNTTNNQDFTHGAEINSNTVVERGDVVIFTINITEVNGGRSYTITDVLNSKLTYISYKSSVGECSFNSSTKTLSCTTTDSGRLNSKVEIKASVNATATAGEVANTASISSGVTPVTCNTKFNITVATPTPSPSPTPTRSPSPTPSPTPSPVPQCNTTCSSSSQCPSGLSCYIPSSSTSGNCRNASCVNETDCLCATASPSPTPVPTPTPSPVPQCNNSCSTNAQCPSNLVCSSGYCRNANCTGESDCICYVPTPAPTKTPTTPPIAYVPGATPAPEPTLPESGTDWPTILGAMFGVLVIVGSLLLAF